MKLIAFLLACFGCTAHLSAATSKSWDTSGFSDFLKGRLSGLSLSAEGNLQLGPSKRWEVNLNQPALWSVASAPDGSVYAATGHSGKVFHISSDGKPPTQIWNAEQAEVFALGIDSKGAVFAGSSPNGGIYRIEGGKAQEIWRSPAKYIWAICTAPDGWLYVGTGEGGRIYRINRDGKGDIYYETGQSNVTALALGPNNHLYAGTEPNGLIYDITGQRQGAILYDSNLPEIRAIAVDASGSVYAAAMGGALSTRSAAAASATTASSTPSVVTATSPTVITVTEAQAGNRARPADNDQASIKIPSDQPRTASTPTAATTNTGAVTEVSGVERSAIYRIAPGGVVETLRSSKEDNVYDLVLDGDSLLFSTDDHGRIYQWRNGKSTLLAEPGDGETTRLIRTASGFYAAMSNPGRLFAFDSTANGTGFFQSPVHDAGSIAHWGHLQWHGMGSGVVFRTRSGNSARPDETWSKWSTPIAESGHDLITSPAARFVQWRGEWSSGSNASVSTVSLPFLPQNAPPSIRSVTVTSILGTNAAKTSANTSTSSAYSVTVTDTGETPAASSSSSGNQVASRLQTTQTQISWQADDPDGDKLVYSLYFRPEEATQWQLVRSRMAENAILLDPDVFADGRYLFRVVASDAPANAPEYAKQAEMISTPVIIDNTPPVVTLDPPRRVDTTADIEVAASDATSPLRRCEYSLDAAFWQPIEAVDGITDSQQERFHIHLEKLRPGEHLVVVRVYDSVGNAGLARVILH